MNEKDVRLTTRILFKSKERSTVITCQNVICQQCEQFLIQFCTVFSINYVNKLTRSPNYPNYFQWGLDN